MDLQGSSSTSRDAPPKSADEDLIFVDSGDWRHSRLLVCQIIVTLCIWVLFGFSSQTIGALLPRLQDYYNLTDISTGLIFLFQVVGYVLLAVTSDALHSRFGLRGVVCLGCMAITLFYLTASAHPPYFLFLAGQFSSGVGMGSLDAALNAWMGNLVDSNQLLGFLHGMFGLGCMMSPPLVSHLVERPKNPWHWSLYFLIMASAGSCLLAAAIVCFRHETPQKYHFLRNESGRNLEAFLSPTGLPTGLLEMDDFNKGPATDLVEPVPFSTIIASPAVLALSFILFLYVGGELSFGSWLITFLTRINKLDHATSSYMATTFWLGLTIGRIVLGFVTAHCFSSELTANFTYMAGLTMGFFLFWVMASSRYTFILFFITFCTGVFVGPIFPTLIVASIEILPQTWHSSGVGLICALGGSGAAGLPMLVGLIALASDKGLSVLPLVVTAIYLTLTVMWLGLCFKYRRTYARNRI